MCLGTFKSRELVEKVHSDVFISFIDYWLFCLPHPQRSPLNILGLGGFRVPILFGIDLMWNDLPYSKGFMRFGCPEPKYVTGGQIGLMADMIHFKLSPLDYGQQRRRKIRGLPIGCHLFKFRRLSSCMAHECISLFPLNGMTVILEQIKQLWF